jgi:fermentation-respiration switch protein FrsA (DUF1100 family)
MSEAMKYADSLPFEELCIKSADGLTLYGRLYEKKKPSATVILLHGYNSSFYMDHCASFRYFYENTDCNVLTVDMRAHGKSEGTYVTYGVKESQDLIRWCKGIENRYSEKHPVLLYGVSMGGATAIMTAGGKEAPKNLGGVITDCSFACFMDDLRYLSKKKKRFPMILLEPGFWNRCIKKAKFDPLDLDLIGRIYMVKVPVLFIHGASDHFVPMEMTAESYKACQAEKRLLTVPDADHAMSYFVGKKEYEKALLDFFRDFDP